jgi:hypothetical protein
VEGAVAAPITTTAASVRFATFKAERETAAFRTALAGWSVQVASELIRCRGRSAQQDASAAKTSWERAHATLAQINLIPLTPEIIELATNPTAHYYEQRTQSTSPPPTMREDLGAIFVYDNDLHAAARAPPRPPRTAMNPRDSMGGRSGT